jgi:RNA polymerase sigma factor (sigma-70 family)
MKPTSGRRRSRAETPRGTAPSLFSSDLLSLNNAPERNVLLVPQSRVFDSYASCSDSTLAAQICLGDSEALSELYRRYAKLAFSVARRIVRDPAATEDLTQEVFLKVWLQAGSFSRTEGRMSGWIVAITRNAALDYLRSCERRSALMRSQQFAGNSSLVDTALNPENAALMQARATSVRGAIERLTSDQRDLIEGVYFQGNTHEQMARRRNKPIGTIKSWVRKAIASMRQDMVQEAGA